jgi:hypothetical protein
MKIIIWACNYKEITVVNQYFALVSYIICLGDSIDLAESHKPVGMIIVLFN